MVSLLRRQDGRRLVEDENVRAAVERLQDLDALAVSHAEIPDACVWVDLEVIVAAQARELGARSAHPGAEPEAALHTEHHVFEHRERLH